MSDVVEQTLEEKKTAFKKECRSCCNRWCYGGTTFFCNEISDMIDNIGEKTEYAKCYAFNRRG